ncbi:MAG: sulfotransferase [Flavobacteriales bacterium]|nr:sulfotransferase [Flavobacteriales bacterium]
MQDLNKIPFLFIIARGRSGTTLLQNIMDANPHVVLPIESKLIIHLKQKYFRVKSWNDKLLDEFIIDLYKDLKFSTHWNVDKQQLIASIKSYPKSSLTFQILCKLIYLSYPSPFKKEDVLLIGDKNPIFSMFVPELREIFPDAKFIHLVRDYRDNIVSNIKTFNFEKLPVLTHGWVAYNKFIENEKIKVPNLFFTLRYEDLVNNPEENILGICNFLQIPYNEKMLNFNIAINERVNEELDEKKKMQVKEIHPNVLKPISTSQIDKWKKHLTSKQLDLIEFVAGDYGKKYKYYPSKDISKSITIKIISLVGLIRQRFNFFIIKNYYRLPFIIRDLMGKISLFLHNKFNYSNYFNNADFRYNGKTTE